MSPTAATRPAPAVKPNRPKTRRRRRIPWFRIVCGVVVAAAAIALWLRIDHVAGQRDATASRAVSAADPVLQLCAEPSPVGQALRSDPRNPCGLAQQVAVEPIPGLPGPAGAAGPAGEAGARGPKGDTGPPGLSPPCLSEPTQCHGPKGDTGETGQTGATGPGGADGQSIKGDKGDTGAPGARGDTGPAGPAGPTCPEGTAPAPVLYADGQTGTGCVTSP